MSKSSTLSKEIERLNSDLRIMIQREKVFKEKIELLENTLSNQLTKTRENEEKLVTQEISYQELLKVSEIAVRTFDSL
jgi:hypothetical protein